MRQRANDKRILVIGIALALVLAAISAFAAKKVCSFVLHAKSETYLDGDAEDLLSSGSYSLEKAHQNGNEIAPLTDEAFLILDTSGAGEIQSIRIETANSFPMISHVEVEAFRSDGTGVTTAVAIMKGDTAVNIPLELAQYNGVRIKFFDSMQMEDILVSSTAFEKAPVHMPGNLLFAFIFVVAAAVWFALLYVLYKVFLAASSHEDKYKVRDGRGVLIKKHILLMTGLMIVFTILFLAAAKLEIPRVYHSVEYGFAESLNKEGVLELGSGQTAVQTFTASEPVTAFEVQVYSEGLSAAGQVEFTLADEDGVAVYSTEVNTGKLLKKTYIPLPKPVEPDGRTWQLRITPTLTSGRCVPFWTGAYDTFRQGELTVDGEETGTDLTFSAMTDGLSFVYSYFWKIFLILLIGFPLLYWLAVLRPVKLHILYFCTALIMGIVLSLIITPGRVADENIHQYSALNVSNALTGDFRGEVDGEMAIAMRLEDMRDISTYSGPADMTTPRIGDWVKVDRELFKTGGITETANVPGHTAGKMWQHIPAGVGFALGRLLGLSQMPTFYMARMLNMLLYLLLTALAIRIIPFGKGTIAATALLFMSVHQGMSISYDAGVNGLSFLFIALCVYAAFEKERRLSWKVILPICVIAVLLGSVKGGAYLPLSLIALLLTQRSDVPVNKKIAVIALILVCAAGGFLAMTAGGTASTVGTGTSGNYSLAFIAQAPKQFVALLYNSLFIDKEYYVDSLLGGYASWLSVKIGSVYMYASLACILAASMKQSTEPTFIRKKDRALFLLIAVFMTGLLFLAALMWTPIGRSTISGVQGRYYIPLLPLMLLSLRSDRISFSRDISRAVVLVQYIIFIFITRDLIIEIVKLGSFGGQK